MTTKPKHRRLRWRAGPTTVLKKLRTEQIMWEKAIGECSSQSQMAKAYDTARGFGWAIEILEQSISEIQP